MLKINISTRNYTFVQIENILKANPNEDIVLEVNNSKELNQEIIRKLFYLNGSNKLFIRIVGAYDDERVNNYPSYRNFHTEDNIYSLNETRSILSEIEKIEKGINPNWDDMQKLMYFIGYLKNKIIYHPFHEKQPSRDIRSLRGLISRKTVCAGYALILKELCDRNGIECQYVEGCCKQEDHNKGYLTHAWNIVKIEGRYVPLDLTWNAGANSSGRLLDIGDLFNVNEFAKTHIPGRKEKIQDYKNELKSIDGVFVRTLNNLINKDSRYDIQSFRGTRKNGSKYRATLVGETVVGNEFLFKYIYQDEFPNGSLGKPVIIYSKTNVMYIISSIRRIEKAKIQLQQARANGNLEEIRKLEKIVDAEKTKHLYDANEMCDELLFSVANINQAIQRRDYYVGKVICKPKKVDVLETTGVLVDTQFGHELSDKYKQKTCRRSDGSTFVIETFGTMRFNGTSPIYRYRIVEPVLENGKTVMMVNTVFSEEELLSDNRQGLYDDFLARDRLDRKVREANGYLGYYSKEGIRTYDPRFNEFFTKSLFRRYTMSLAYFKDYYKEITFDEMKRLVATYEDVFVNGTTIYRNRITKRQVEDEDLLLHIRFSYLWLSAAGLDFREGENIPGYNDAFKPEAENVFKYISQLLINSMNINGNIDPVSILERIRESRRYNNGDNIVVRLFSSPEAVEIINKLYRLQNPSAMEEKQDIGYFSKGRMSNAEIMLNRRKNLEAKKIILEVLKNASGQVEVVQKK